MGRTRLDSTETEQDRPREHDVDSALQEKKVMRQEEVTTLMSPDRKNRVTSRTSWPESVLMHCGYVPHTRCVQL